MEKIVWDHFKTLQGFDTCCQWAVLHLMCKTTYLGTAYIDCTKVRWSFGYCRTESFQKLYILLTLTVQNTLIFWLGVFKTLYAAYVDRTKKTLSFGFYMTECFQNPYMLLTLTVQKYVDLLVIIWPSVFKNPICCLHWLYKNSLIFLLSYDFFQIPYMPLTLTAQKYVDLLIIIWLSVLFF